MRARATQTEMNQLVRDMEPIFQRLVKIDPFDVDAHRALASVETSAKYVLFRHMNKIIVFIYLKF